MGSTKSSKSAVVAMLTLQVTFIILFALFVEYDPNADAKTTNPNTKHFDETYPRKLC